MEKVHFLIHSTLLLVSLKTFVVCVFEMPSGLAFLNGEAVQQLVSLEELSRDIQNSEKYKAACYVW